MRWLNKLYANAFGFFWLPCPVCGKEFGGHEISNLFTSALVNAEGRAFAVCPDPQCSHDAAIRNVANGHQQTYRALP